MKDQEIYKGLRIQDNKLMFKKEVIFEFKDNNINDQYKINKSIYDIKRYLLNHMKLYLSGAYAYQVTRDNALITLDLYCNIDNEKFKRKIEFISFFDNEIIYL